MINQQEEDEMRYQQRQQQQRQNQQQQQQTKESQSRSTVYNKYISNNEIISDSSTIMELDDPIIGITGYTLDNLSYGNENLWQWSNNHDFQSVIII